MTKHELIESLQAVQATESASAVCIDNIIGTLSWTGLSEEQQASVAALLEKLSNGADRRARQLVDYIRRIEGSGNDVL